MWNTSNILSFSRLLMAVPVGFSVWYQADSITVLLCFLASVTDILDGYFARKFNQVSEMGKVIDPLADKVFVITLVLFMVIMGRFPIWLAGAIVVRDILILAGGIYATKKLGYVLPSNIMGKAAVTTVGFYILFILFGWTLIAEIASFIVLTALIISFIQYLIRMVKLISKK